mmetsp:Transcript_549/g.848  ORF Transcript_549/g.848 Transcript_549/m.848 type:complete len:272 (-) Transcript_549:2476-3291(-)
MGVQNRWALVTGAASGMGFSIALTLAENGAKIACCDIQSCDKIVQEIESSVGSGKCKSFQFDASEKGSINSLVESVLSWTGGRLDILVNNAGVVAPAPLSLEDDEFEKVWERSFAINVDAQQRLSRAMLSALKSSQHSGRIVNIASTEGLGATMFQSAYVSSKHACVGLSKALAVELGSQGVTVNCICPGPVRTAMTEFIQEKSKEYYSKRLVPLRRYGFPTEIAYVVLCLVDDRATFINGSVINVDGGLLCNNGLLPMKLPWDNNQTSNL